MTGSGSDEPSERFRGTEYPSLEDSAAQRGDPHPPVDYPTDAGLPPPVYPPPYANPPGYPPTPGYYAGAAYDPYRPTKPPGTNGQAIAALVCSVAGFFCCLPSIVGLILGVMAMRETKRTGQDGYPLALVATILGGLVVAGLALYLLLYVGVMASGWQWAP
jgi:Domain of unknown function (DUF4190)